LSIKLTEVTVVSVAQILKNYSSSESSSSDEKYELTRKKKRVKCPRIENYAQTVVSRYIDYEFKNHFRLNIIFYTFNKFFKYTKKIFNYINRSTNKYIINVFILSLV